MAFYGISGNLWKYILPTLFTLYHCAYITLFCCTLFGEGKSICHPTFQGGKPPELGAHRPEPVVGRVLAWSSRGAGASEPGTGRRPGGGGGAAATGTGGGRRAPFGPPAIPALFDACPPVN